MAGTNRIAATWPGARPDRWIEDAVAIFKHAEHLDTLLLGERCAIPLRMRRARVVAEAAAILGDPKQPELAYADGMGVSVVFPILDSYWDTAKQVGRVRRTSALLAYLKDEAAALEALATRVA